MRASCSPIGARSGKVMAVVIPTAVYVALIPYVGIYVASALLIAVFMCGSANIA